MFRQYCVRVVLICAAAIVSVSGVSAQSKIGVINIQRALIETAEIKKAQGELEARFKPRTTDLENLQRELQELQAKLQKPGLSPADQQDVTATGQRKQREMTRKEEDLRADVERERNEILQRAGQRMTDVVKKLADEKGLDVVVDVTTTVFYKAALELTNDAVVAYDKTFPVK